ncbi:hypothetical protein BJ742DRAFT_788200 [Cladochytrium replicatum]|nr:hypothetical protein BJ742DRAFT_788200 [Cladochytrium replicatum]
MKRDGDSSPTSADALLAPLSGASSGSGTTSSALTFAYNSEDPTYERNDTAAEDAAPSSNGSETKLNSSSRPPSGRKSKTARRRDGNFYLAKLSISEFTNLPKRKANSGNFGVVELTVIHAAEKCILSKMKWIVAMEISGNTAKRIVSRTTSETDSDSESNRNAEIHVVAESEDGLQTIEIIPQVQKDQTILDIEKTLTHRASVLWHLIRTYELSQEAGVPISQPHWRTISFTKVRKGLLEAFANNRHSPISLQFSSLTQQSSE